MRGGIRRCVLLNVTDCITLLGLCRSPQEVNKPIPPFDKSDVPPSLWTKYNQDVKMQNISPNRWPPTQ